MGEIILKIILGYFIVFYVPALINKLFIIFKKKNKKFSLKKKENIQRPKTQSEIDYENLIAARKKDQLKIKLDFQSKYEKKYFDLGLKKPKKNKRRVRSSEHYDFVHPIVSRIIKYDISEVRKGNIENTTIAKLLKDLIKNTNEEITDLKIAGLNGPAKKISDLKLNDEEKIKKFFDYNIYNKQIAKGYSIEFKPVNWSFHKRLKNYDNWFKERVAKGEEYPPFSDFIKDIINPIRDELYLNYKSILDKYCLKNLSKLRLSPPHGQKIRILVYILTTAKEVVYYNQNYLTDYGKTHLNKIIGEIDELFKNKNVSFHYCYEDSFFRAQAIRLAENNFRKKNNVPIIGEGWTSQTDLFNRLKIHFKSIEKEFSPRWIKPKRIDIYIKKYKVAIEYHGYQHYFPLHFFGGEKAFLKRKTDDKLKMKACLKNRSSFIEWPYDFEINDKNIIKIKKYIEENTNNIYAINAKNFSNLNL